MLDRFVERSFHIDPFFETKVTDCIPQCRVAHEEDLRLEYLRLRLPQAPPDTRLNLQQLALGRGDGGVESFDFL